MPTEYPKPINRLVEAFKKLPGVGPRSARRMAWHIIDSQYEEAVELARAIVRVKKSIKHCSICCNYTDLDPCAVCSDPARDRSVVCVVEAPEDVAALERAGWRQGVYHVLGGTINTASGAGPDKLRIDELVERVKKGEVREVLIATDPSVEGETTAIYLAKMLKPYNVRLTRPARGIPAGADIDFLDNDTLTGAFRSRQEILPEEKG